MGMVSRGESLKKEREGHDCFKWFRAFSLFFFESNKGVTNERK